MNPMNLVKFTSKAERERNALKRREKQVKEEIKQIQPQSTFSNQQQLDYFKPKEQKQRKVGDKKFIFDWDTKEDTFINQVPPHEARFFGRGRLAGFHHGRFTRLITEIMMLLIGLINLLFK